ncbi:3'-5' exonuclease [Pseudomonas sp. NPDC077649]|uniref:3'-5' exonuclease n=1 Tax=Pseudomonas sp. NPDC077649 TaxID=3364423 RepID=UPI0037C8DE4C
MSAANWSERLRLLGEAARDPRLAAFYRAGCPAAETPLGEAPLLALDVETTGLEPGRDAIVSLGLVPFDLRRIRCQEARYWVVRPSSELHGDSVTFHHITHSDVRHAPPLDAVLGEVLEALAGKLVVVHYHRIERGFLDQALRRQMGEGLLFPLLDTMALEARLHPRRRPGLLGRLRGQRPISIRLADSRQRYGLPAYRAHHALSDALATAELLQAQAATHHWTHTPVGELWH